MALKLLFLLSYLLVLPLSIAQDTQAENLFNNAATFMAAGKHQDALKDYQTIVDKYAESEWADKALLEIGDYYRNTQQNDEQALVFFTLIKESYPNSDSAPAAYYFSSLIRENLAVNKVELDAAGTDLVRMVGLYPNSAWEPEAFYLMGRINFRMGNLDLARLNLQNLFLFYPHSPLVPKSFILRSKIAYYSGRNHLALEILARMQATYSSDHEAFEESRQLGRLINRMSQQRITYRLDRNFPASTPKTYKNPKCVSVDSNGLILIIDSNGLHFLEKKSNSGNISHAALNVNHKDAVEITLGPDGHFALGLENQVLHIGETVTTAPINIDELDSFAIDDFGKYYILESRARDTNIYDRKGAFLRKLGVEKMKKVRTRGTEIWILAPDGNNLIRYSGALQHLGAAASFERIKDFCFDALGNLYVIYNKGSKLAIMSRNGKRKAELDFKTGSYPLRSATSVAVDTSGAIYLVDSKGGAVYRFI